MEHEGTALDLGISKFFSMQKTSVFRKKKTEETLLLVLSLKANSDLIKVLLELTSSKLFGLYKHVYLRPTRPYSTSQSATIPLFLLLSRLQNV